METVSDFIFLGSKITADGDCSHEIKRRFLLGRKVMTNLDSIFKSRDNHILYNSIFYFSKGNCSDRMEIRHPGKDIERRLIAKELK